MIFNVEWRPGGYYAVTPDGVAAGPFATHDQALAYAERREEFHEHRLPS